MDGIGVVTIVENLADNADGENRLRRAVWRVADADGLKNPVDDS